MLIGREKVKAGEIYYLDGHEVEVVTVSELLREGFPSDFGGYGSFPAVTYRKRGDDNQTNIMLLSSFAMKAYPAQFVVTSAMTPEEAMRTTLAAIEDAMPTIAKGLCRDRASFEKTAAVATSLVDSFISYQPIPDEFPSRLRDLLVVFGNHVVLTMKMASDEKIKATLNQG